MVSVGFQLAQASGKKPKAKGHSNSLFLKSTSMRRSDLTN